MSTPNFRRAALASAIGLLSFSTGAFAQVDKQAAHDEMRALSQQIEALRSTGSFNSAEVGDLQNRISSLSASLGGDLPVATGQAAAPGDNGVLGAGPPSPPGCAASTTSASNNTPVALVDVGVVTSTILVAGAGTHLWDVDVTTFIRHTFAADLDITITSPAGTVVTLTTDNGAGNDDVFNGTVWDDSANPAGQVPYVTNAGVVTDHPFANLTLASPLVPEEALSAFVGENPNGTWTLTISDDLAGDTGTLDQWSLNLTTFPAAPFALPVASFDQTTPVAIPTGPAVVSSTLAVSGLAAPVCKAVLRTNMPHTFAADLDFTLASPAGAVTTLSTDNGAGNDNVFAGTVWDDDANPAGVLPYVTNNGLATDHAYVNLTLASPLVPEESMGLFMGQDGNGTWTLTVSDDLAGDGGSIDSWGLDLTTCTCTLADLALTLADAPDPVTAGTSYTYTAVSTNNGPSPADDVTISLPLPVGTTFVSASASGSGNCVAGNPVVCTWAGATAATAANTATVTVSVPANAVAGSVLSTTATTSSTTLDPDASNNEAPASTTVATSADLVTTLTASPATVAPGLSITYAGSVLNNGPSDAQDVQLTVALGAGVGFSSATPSAGGSCSTPAFGSGGSVVCTWAGATASGTSRSVSVIGFSYNQGAAGATASASSATTDPTPGNNSASASVSVSTGGGVTPPAFIPTASTYGLAFLAVLLGLLGFAAVRRQH